jgi:D-psicose/D-tagatose/L-ribulose 3-epimerase
MKIGISTWLWLSHFTDENVDLIKKIAQLGFDQIEFPLEDIDQFDYTRAASLLRDLGLKVSLTAVLREDRDLTIDDSSRNDAALAYLRHSVDAVVALGGNIIGGGIYGGVGRVAYLNAEQRARALERVGRKLRPVAKYAEDKGVVFGIETLVRFRSAFINTIAEALELAAIVDNPAMGVMADTFHMNVEEKNIVAAIEQADKRLVHVHANENDRGAPGSGHMDWPAIRAALRKIDYRGALVIEAFGGELKERGKVPPDAARDAIARQGCQFLKELFA